jgi:hypothetical protein
MWPISFVGRSVPHKVPVWCVYCVPLNCNPSGSILGCIQKFPDWPPGARTANGIALCHYVQLYHYFMSQSYEFCVHNPLCCFWTSSTKGKPIFHYRLSPETFGYTLVYACRHFPLLNCPMMDWSSIQNSYRCRKYLQSKNWFQVDTRQISWFVRTAEISFGITNTTWCRRSSISIGVGRPTSCLKVVAHPLPPPPNPFK